MGFPILISLLTYWALACDFQQCGILTSVDLYKPVQPPVKLRTFKRCSVSSLTVIEYTSDKQRLWSDCAYAQADLSLCWSHILHCWKSHALAHIHFQFSAKTNIRNMKKMIHLSEFHAKTDKYRHLFQLKNGSFGLMEVDSMRYEVTLYKMGNVDSSVGSLFSSD